MDESGRPGEWVRAWNGAHESDAEIIAGALRAEGIDAVARGDEAARYYAPAPLAPSLHAAWSVWVREGDFHAAIAHLEATDATRGAISAPDDFASRARVVFGLMLLLVIGCALFALWAT